MQLRQQLSAGLAAVGEALVDGDNANGAAEPEVKVYMPNTMAVLSNSARHGHPVVVKALVDGDNANGATEPEVGNCRLLQAS